MGGICIAALILTAIAHADRLHVVAVYGQVAGSIADVNTVGMIAQDWGDSSIKIVAPSPYQGRGIRKAIDGLNVEARDIVLFYYSGHGAWDNIGHHLTLDNGEKLYRTVLLNYLRRKGARLTILLTDCCSNWVGQPAGIAMGRVQKGSSRQSWISKNLQSLFAYKGVVDITSARKGQSAWGEPNGGIFTRAAWVSLYSDKCETWGQFSKRVLIRTQSSYAFFRARILKTPGLDRQTFGLITAQTQQIPYTFHLPIVRRPELALPNRSSFNVRIVNRTGQTLRLALIGYRSEANLRLRMPVDSSFTDPELFAGERVLIGWDVNGTLILIKKINVNQNGTLVVGVSNKLGANEIQIVGAAARSRPSYSVRLENGHNQWLKVALIGVNSKANLRLGMPIKSWYKDPQLFAGERVLICWTKEQRIVLTAKVDVLKHGRLTIAPDQP